MAFSASCMRPPATFLRPRSDLHPVDEEPERAHEHQEFDDTESHGSGTTGKVREKRPPAKVPPSLLTRVNSAFHPDQRTRPGYLWPDGQPVKRARVGIALLCPGACRGGGRVGRPPRPAQRPAGLGALGALGRRVRRQLFRGELCHRTFHPRPHPVDHRTVHDENRQSTARSWTWAPMCWAR